MSNEALPNTVAEVKPLVFSELPIFPLESFPLAPTTLKTLELLVRSDRGCLIMFYGDRPEMGKTSLAVSLASRAGKSAFFLEREPAIGTDEVQKDLESLQVRLNPAEHVLIVDDDEDLLHSRSNFNNFLPRPWLVGQLKANRLPVIWIVDSVEQIPRVVLGLFDYVFKFSESVEKTFQWPPSVERSWHPALEKFLGFGAGELTRSIAVWEKTLQPDESLVSQESRLSEIMERRSLIGVTKVEPVIAPVTEFLDTTLWNTDVPLRQIEDGVGAYLKWLPSNLQAKEPYAVLCSGAPGSGKSAFLKHLAQIHGLTLRVFRSSDIMRSLVGETEQMIASVFKDVKPTEAVLLEECDSILYSRTRSHYRFEVSAINEFLSQLESFPGLVFCSTNFLGSLDEAVARRFVAKVVFFPLKAEQVPSAWATYFADLSPPEGIDHLLEGLCAGDFKTVAMKRLWSLATSESHEVLADLVREKEAKERFTKTSRKVGFH